MVAADGLLVGRSMVVGKQTVRVWVARIRGREFAVVAMRTASSVGMFLAPAVRVDLVLVVLVSRFRTFKNLHDSSRNSAQGYSKNEI